MEVAIEVELNHSVTVARAQFLRAIVNIVKNAIEATVGSKALQQRIEIIVASGEDEIGIHNMDWRNVGR